MVTLIIALAITGAFAGFLGALFGLGGGVVVVPILYFFFSEWGAADAVQMHQSLATALALIPLPSLIAAIRQYKLGNLELSYFKNWWPPLFVGVVAGVVIEAFASTAVLQVIFAGFILLVSIYLGLVPARVVIAKAPPTGAAKRVLATGVGCLAVLLGTGGGIIAGPILQACSYNIKRSIALCSASAVLVGVGGAIGALIAGLGVPGRAPYSIGYINLIALVILLPLAMLMAPLGARTAHRMNPRLLRLFYAIFTLIMATSMILELVGVIP